MIYIYIWIIWTWFKIGYPNSWAMNIKSRNHWYHLVPFHIIHGGVDGPTLVVQFAQVWCFRAPLWFQKPPSSKSSPALPELPRPNHQTLEVKPNRSYTGVVIMSFTTYNYDYDLWTSSVAGTKSSFTSLKNKL